VAAVFINFLDMGWLQGLAKISQNLRTGKYSGGGFFLGTSLAESLSIFRDLAMGETAATKRSAGGMRRGQECPRCQIIGKTRDADTNVKRIRPPPE
jgi:hypothetical protein